MEDQIFCSNQNIINKMEKEAYVYALFPFNIIPPTDGSLFDDIGLVDYGQDQIFSCTKQLEDQIRILSLNKSKLQGDLTKYYDFMQYHFGDSNDNRGINVFELRRELLFPSCGYEKFKNANVLLDKGAVLGESSIVASRIESLTLIINSIAGVGYFLCGLHCTSSADNSIVDELKHSEFFRNIGWRKNRQISSTQKKKFSLNFIGTELSLTFRELLDCYLSNFSSFIRFYQDRPIVLYSVASKNVGKVSDSMLRELTFEIIRIPDRNSAQFLPSVSEPSIHRIGRNVVFAALNEGAFIAESANDDSSCKNIANKYFPAFFFALNQREILLNTMHKIAKLDVEKLKKFESGIFLQMENMRNSLLVLQLKQIFYSLSNLHEVELFFNQLQKVFAIEKMLMENDQCIREMYNLLEYKKNDELEKIEKKKYVNEVKRSNLYNTILGAIACLSLFSFFKDLLPFIQDSQYASIYKFTSVFLPLLVMLWLVWYMSSKNLK